MTQRPNHLKLTELSLSFEIFEIDASQPNLNI